MFLADSLTNLVSGLGSEKDKATYGRFAFNYLTKAELDAAYSNNWIAQKLVNAPADDSTREWRTWDVGKINARKLLNEERRLNVRGVVNRAMRLARLHGGSLVILGTGDGDPMQPLDIDRIKAGGLLYLHVLSRWEVATGPLDRDPQSQHYGEPEWYELYSPGNTVRLHPSRAVRFYGIKPMEVLTSFDGWGLSILQPVYDQMRDSAALPQALAALAQEAKVDIIQMPNLTQNAINPDYRAKITARFALANMSKSVVNALLLDAEEKWTQKVVSPTGWPDAIRIILEIVAGAADMPATRLLGTAPKGLSATGESDLRNYYDMLSSRQEVDLRPALHRMDEAVKRSALGANPAGADYYWNSLWQLRENEASSIALQKAQTADIYATLGIMPPSALRKAVTAGLVQDGTYPGLAEALAEALIAGEASAPLIARPDKVETNSPKPAPAKV